MSEAQVVDAVSALYGIGTDARVRDPVWGQCIPVADIDDVGDRLSREWNAVSLAVGVMEGMPDQLQYMHHWEEIPEPITRPENRKAETAYMYHGAIEIMGIDTVIKVCDVVGSEFCIGFRDGDRTFVAIRDIISQGKRAVISFENVRSLSAAFLESAIGPLYKGEIPEAKLEECIGWKGVSSSRKLLIERAIAEARGSRVVS